MKTLIAILMVACVACAEEKQTMDLIVLDGSVVVWMNPWGITNLGPVRTMKHMTTKEFAESRGVQSVADTDPRVLLAVIDLLKADFDRHTEVVQYSYMDTPEGRKKRDELMQRRKKIEAEVSAVIERFRQKVERKP